MGFNDPLGLLVIPLHRGITLMAAKAAGCTDSYAKQLADLVALVDSVPGSQDPINSNWHHMASGGQDIASAEAAYKNYTNAIKSMLKQKANPYGLAFLIHAEQDSIAYGHENYQEWDGFPSFFDDPIGWSIEAVLFTPHLIGDTFPWPSTISQELQITKDLIDSYGGCDCNK